MNGVETNYTLDIEAGLTQVLSDGGSAFLYGVGRIAQAGSGERAYFLGDALNSARQLVDDAGQVGLGRAYEPYGDILSIAGEMQTAYGFAGEWRDETGLVHLRARYYAPGDGRFVQPDPFGGIATSPISHNPYPYGQDNPLRYTDPSGSQVCIPGLRGFEECTQDEKDKWARHMAAAGQFFTQAGEFSQEALKLIGSTGNQGVLFVSGFYTELIDSLLLVPFASTMQCLTADLLAGLGIDPAARDRLDYDRSQTAFVLGRYLGRSTAYAIGLAEMGLGTLGLGLSLGEVVVTSPTGVLAIAGGLGAVVSGVVVLHGFAVIANVAARSVADPLPNVVFAETSGRWSTDRPPEPPYDTRSGREQLARQIADEAGGTVGPAGSGDGLRVTIRNAGAHGKNIVVRIMHRAGQRVWPYWRVAEADRPALTLSGIESSDELLTHHPFTSRTFDEMLRLIRAAMGG